MIFAELRRGEDLDIVQKGYKYIYIYIYIYDAVAKNNQSSYRKSYIIEDVLLPYNVSMKDDLLWFNSVDTCNVKMITDLLHLIWTQIFVESLQQQQQVWELP